MTVALDSSVPRETVALVIPLYNEEAVLPLLIEAVEAFRAARPEVTQVVLVDDGSRDRTRALVHALTAGRPGYRLVSFARNFGHQLAVTAGLHFVETDAAILLDADLQDPLEVAGEMIDRWREGFDVVYGVRAEREGETAFKKATAALFYRFFRGPPTSTCPSTRATSASCRGGPWRPTRRSASSSRSCAGS